MKWNGPNFRLLRGRRTPKASFTRYDTSNLPTFSLLTCATQRFPARELHVEKHGDRDAMVCYHRVGTPQGRDDVSFLHAQIWSNGSEEDIVVHQDKENPDWVYGIDASEDGKYIYIYTYKDTSKARFQFLLPDFTNSHTFSKISCGLESSIRMGSSREFHGGKSLMILRRITTCETFPASQSFFDSSGTV